MPHDRVVNVVCGNLCSINTFSDDKQKVYQKILLVMDDETSETDFSICGISSSRGGEHSSENSTSNSNSSSNTAKCGSGQWLTMAELGELFLFEPVESLLFLHEADLRHVVFEAEYSTEVLPDFLTQTIIDGLLLDQPKIRTEELVCASASATLAATHVNPNVYIKRVGIVDECDVGHGLFALKDLPKGQFIGEYLGIVQRSSRENCNTAYSLSYPSSDGKLEINAAEYGNIIRFVNHSQEPNGAFIRVLLDGMIHVACVS